MGMVRYYYDALGNLHRREAVRNSQVAGTRDYMDDFEFFKGIIDQVHHSQGHVELEYVVGASHSYRHRSQRYDSGH